MKKMRKWIALTLIAAMLCLTFAGCSNKADGGSEASNEPTSDEPAANEPVTDEPVKLVCYTLPSRQEQNQEILALFNKQYPNITVEFIDLPTNSNEQFQTISTSLQSHDSSVDIICMDCTWPQAFISAGWLSPLDDVMTEEDYAMHYENSLEIGRYNDHQYTMPTFINSGLLFYRKDLLEKYNYEVPETWDELTEIAKDIMSKEPEITAGYASAWKQYEGLVCCAMEFIWAEGGDVLDADGNVIINSPEVETALTRMYDMIYTDKIADTGINGYMWTDARSLFYSGNCLFIRDWPTVITGAEDSENSNVVGKVGFAELPKGAGNVSYNAMGGWQVGVSVYSEHQEEAKCFAKFFSGYEAQKVRAKIAELPSIPSVLEDPDVVAAVPYLPEMVEIGENTKSRPRTAYYEEFSAVMQKGVGSILTNVMDVPTAIAEMEKGIKEILSR